MSAEKQKAEASRAMLIISGSKSLGRLSRRLQGSQMAVPTHWSPQGPAVIFQMTGNTYEHADTNLLNYIQRQGFRAEGTANFQHTQLLTKGTLSKKGV